MKILKLTILIFLVLVGFFFLFGAEKPLVRQMSQFATNDFNLHQRSEIVAKYIPYGSTKKSAEETLQNSGFTKYQTPESVIQKMHKEGIQADEFLDFALQRGLYPVAAYGIRLGFYENKLVYINASASERHF